MGATFAKSSRNRQILEIKKCLSQSAAENMSQNRIRSKPQD